MFFIFFPVRHYEILVAKHKLSSVDCLKIIIKCLRSSRRLGASEVFTDETPVMTSDVDDDVSVVHLSHRLQTRYEEVSHC